VHSAVHDTIASVWRIESAQIVAAVARRVRDLGVAEALLQDKTLQSYPLLHAVHADLLQKLGRQDEARAALHRAAALARNEQERALLMQQAQA